jgi:tetratricopeptide (TPR) repeat protein
LARRLAAGPALSRLECRQLSAEIRWFGRNWSARHTLSHVKACIGPNGFDPPAWHGDVAGLRAIRADLSVLLTESADFRAALALLDADFGLSDSDLLAPGLPGLVLGRCLAEGEAPVLLRAVAALAGALGNLRGAVALLENCAGYETGEDQAEIRIRLCELHIDLGNPAAAGAALARIGEGLQPESRATDNVMTRLRLLRADLDAQEGRYSAAREGYDLLLRTWRVEAARNRLVQILTELNQLDRALVLLDEGPVDDTAELLRQRVEARSVLTARRLESTADLLLDPLRQDLETVDDALLESHLRDLHQIARTVTARRSARLRADLERICTFAERFASVGRTDQAEILLRVARALAQPADSALFEGFLAMAEARCLFGGQIPHPRKAAEAAARAMRHFQTAGFLPKAVSAETLHDQIARRFGFETIGPNLRQRFLGGLGFADLEGYLLTDWTQKDQRVSELLEPDENPPPDRIAAALGIAHGLDGPVLPRPGRLPYNSALLAFVATQDHLYPVFHAPGDAWRLLGPARAVTRQGVTRAVAAVLRVLNERRRAEDPHVQDTLAALSDMIGLPRVVGALEACGAERLQILSSEILSQVPVGLLPVWPGKCLLQRHILTLVHKPGAGRRAAKPGQAWLGITNGAGDPENGLPDLPGADDVLPASFSAARAPRADLLEGDRATWANVEQRIDAAQVIVTLCHGRGASRGKDAALLLRDGWWTAEDIAARKLSARTVVLLGCWGYAHRAVDGGKAGSVAAAFAEAGAGERHRFAVGAALRQRRRNAGRPARRRDRG